MADEEWNDPIVEEVRRVRDANAAKFGYDIDAIFADLVARQEQLERKLVTHPPRAPLNAPNEGAA